MRPLPASIALLAASLVLPATAAAADGPMRIPELVPLARLGLGGGGTSADDGGAAFTLEAQLGLRSRIHDELGLSLNPFVGYLLHAGPAVHQSLEVGGDVSLEGVAGSGLTLSYTASVVLELDRDATRGIRHGPRVEVISFIGIALMHHVADGNYASSHTIDLTLTIDFGPLLYELSGNDFVR